MQSVSEKVMYERVADNIRDNIIFINKLLNDCEVKSKVVAEEEKILKFYELDINKLFKDEPKSDYYDLEKVSKILGMLETSKQGGKRKRKFTRSESSVSLTPSSSGQSSEDISASVGIDEIKAKLAKIRTVLSNIKNINIDLPDLQSIERSQASKTSNFVDLLMKLQKLSKELQGIAPADNSNEYESLSNIHELVNGLNVLLQKLSDVELSRSNPVTEVPKIDHCSFPHSNVINAALEAIEKNPL